MRYLVVHFWSKICLFVCVRACVNSKKNCIPQPQESALEARQKDIQYTNINVCMPWLKCVPHFYWFLQLFCPGTFEERNKRIAVLCCWLMIDVLIDTVYDVWCFKFQAFQASSDLPRLPYFVGLYLCSKNVQCAVLCVVRDWLNRIYLYAFIFKHITALILRTLLASVNGRVILNSHPLVQIPTEVGVVIRILLLQNICTIYLPLLGLYPEA